MEKLCHEIWLACRTELCGLYPALNGAFACLRQKQGQLLGTDGVFLYASRELVRRYGEDPARVRRGYLHILLHCLFLHVRLPDAVEPEDWGLACDLWVEKFIDSLEEPRLQAEDPLLAAVTQWAQGTPWEILKALPRLPWPREQVERTVCFDDHSLWVPNPPGSVIETWSRLAGTGLDGAGGLRGSASPDIWETPGEMPEKAHDFHRFLQRYTVPGEEMELDTDSMDYLFYHLGMERYGNLPLIEPLEYREVWRLDTLAIAIDTSASCDKALVSRFLRETYEIFSARENFFRRMRVVFFQCDCCLQDWKIVDSPDSWFAYGENLTIRGRGGTDYTPVFRQLESMIRRGELEKPRALLYFTDGDGVYPEPPDYETVFVLAGAHQRPELVPKWAHTLSLE